MKFIAMLWLLGYAAQALANPLHIQLDKVSEEDASDLNSGIRAHASAPAGRIQVDDVSDEDFDDLDDGPSANVEHDASMAGPLERRRPPHRVPRSYWNVARHANWLDPSVLDDLPWKYISHVVFDHARINDDGTVVSSNETADLPHVMKLREIKVKHRHVKVIISIGGTTFSQDGQFNRNWDKEWRETFAVSAVDLMQHYGFDGIDISWEYPSAIIHTYLYLLEVVRWELNRYQQLYANNTMMMLTQTSHLAAEVYGGVRWPLMVGLLNAWFLKSYDYSGPWSQKSAHQANVYDEGSDTTVTSTSHLIMDFWDNKTDPRKMMLGVPAYGHSFIQPTSLFGSTFNRTEIDADVVLYKDIDEKNWECGNSYDIHAAWCHDGNRLISFDNVESVKSKTYWAVSAGLHGICIWPAYGDKPGRDSLFKAVYDTLPHLETYVVNLLNYPISKYGFRGPAGKHQY